MPLDPAAVANALQDVKRAAKAVHSQWALVGGQALIVYGVPRHTEDADIFTEPDLLEDVADELIKVYDWTPLEYDETIGGYVTTDETVVHSMDDPVLFDIGEERRMIPLQSSMEIVVELLAAQHPIEVDMIDFAAVHRHYGVQVPVAPLGGVLLVKTKADRSKDRMAIEQVSEHLSNEQLREAIAWANLRDPATTEDLMALIHVVRVRRTPKSKAKGRKRKR